MFLYSRPTLTPGLTNVATLILGAVNIYNYMAGCLLVVMFLYSHPTLTLGLTHVATLILGAVNI